MRRSPTEAIAYLTGGELDKSAFAGLRKGWKSRRIVS
jgi:hypothetical protein